MKDNLDLWNEDVIEVFLWTDETYPLYFEYEISPLNYELALLVPNINGNFLGWIPWKYEGGRKIKHATSVRGGDKASGENITSWIAEFFIPYEILKPLDNVPPKKGSSWRVNMYRIDYDGGKSIWAWKEVTGTFHEYKKYGTLRFE